MRKIAEPPGLKMQVVSPKVLLSNSVQPGGRGRLYRGSEVLYSPYKLESASTIMYWTVLVVKCNHVSARKTRSLREEIVSISMSIRIGHM
jgi:hypothetical protein